MCMLKCTKKKTEPCVTPLMEDSAIAEKDLMRIDRKIMNIFLNFSRFLSICSFSKVWSIEGCKGVKGYLVMCRNYKIFHLWLYFLVLVWIQILSSLKLNVNGLCSWANTSRLGILNFLYSTLSSNPALTVSVEVDINCPSSSVKHEILE